MATSAIDSLCGGDCDGDRETRQRVTQECFAALAAATSPRERTDLRERVINANLGVARAIALRYRGRGIPSEDLLQVARMALVVACQSFDPARGHDFLTYAVPTIRGTVLRYFRDQGWMVRPPRRIRELQSRILQLDPTARDGLDEEGLARMLGEPVGAVREALEARGCFRPESIDAPVGDGSATLADRLPGVGEEAFASVDARVAASAALQSLDDRAKRMLRLRFFEGWSQQQIGEALGMTQVQVSRHLHRILEQVREIVEPDDAFHREAL